MGEWWKILLSLTVSGTALAVLTAGLIRLLRGRVPCRWLCGLWLLVLLRFLALNNHSYLHCFFTYRALVCPIFALLVVLTLYLPERRAGP